jgi:hypothetical protein
MTICDETVAAALADISDGWSCLPVGDGVLLVTGSSHYADGDTPEVLVRIDGAEATVSDGGETRARLDLADVNLETGRARQMWQSLIRAHRLEVADGRLLLHGPSREVGTLVVLMTDAMINLDGLRLLAPAPKQPRFAEKVVTFLQAEFESVEERPELQGRSGSSYRLTAAVGREDRPVYVQALAGNTQPQRIRAVEHGFTVFSDVNGSLDQRQRLIVLDGAVEQWTQGRLALLEQVAYVGSWKARDRLVGFIGADAPPTTRLLDNGEQLPTAGSG